MDSTGFQGRVDVALQPSHRNHMSSASGKEKEVRCWQEVASGH